MSRKEFVAGNWKMYKTTAEAVRFAEEFRKIAGQVNREIAVCAPFTQLEALKKAFAGTDVKIGAQNMHFEEEGAYTGEISADMLTEIGCDYCVIGHSERRQYFAETDETVNRKLKTAFAHGITPILCVGEVLEERDAGREQEVVRTQLEGAMEGIPNGEAAEIVIAYEPVWAIGTGRTATPEQAEEMCGNIRKVITELFSASIADVIRIQYGGSVKPTNAAELLSKPNIDGALVGGASLVPEQFLEICTAQ
jgi:triosephosphate isomerase